MRSSIALGGLAAAATGIAVVAGVVHPPTASADLAGSLSRATAPAAASAHVLQDRAPIVSRSGDRARTDRRQAQDPTKEAALGLSSGPVVSGRENLSAQDPQAIAEALLPTYGFDSSQMSCLVPLWMGESGWRWNAENASSGAYGIPQSLPGDKMASVASDWRTNPVTQIKWGLEYIKASYGTPCGAWGFKQGHGWY